MTMKKLNFPEFLHKDGSPFIIAEVAQTHDGSLGLAHAFIDAVASTGASAIKFQTHIASEESSPAEPWRVHFSLQDKTRFDYWRRMEFSLEQWAGLKQHAEEVGLLFMSSPFSVAAVEMLDSLGMDVWKIPSGEVGNPLLFDAVLATRKPVILSSGMSSWEELDSAVLRLREMGNPYCSLQCTSAYPCPPERIGLNAMLDMKQRYDCPVGLSDHSGAIFTGIAAITLGAVVLEVHVALSRQMFGPDVASSVTVEELSALVRGARLIRTAVTNQVDKDAEAHELAKMRRIFQKSLVARKNLPAGHILERSDFTAKKPGTGIPVSRINDCIGRCLKRSVAFDKFLEWEDLE